MTKQAFLASHGERVFATSAIPCELYAECVHVIMCWLRVDSLSQLYKRQIISFKCCPDADGDIFGTATINMS
eukprot:COSAG02_NODE_26936_length_620_cov_1.662188_1_plen_71_part_01